MDNEMLDRLIKRRYESHKKVAIEKGLPIISLDTLTELFYKNYNNGFICEYCRVGLEFGTKFDYSLTPSLEHRISIDAGGSNISSNLAVVCCRCNIVKGTLSEETYRELLSKLGNDQNFITKLFREWNRSKFANKMERVDNSKITLTNCDFCNENKSILCTKGDNKLFLCESCSNETGITKDSITANEKIMKESIDRSSSLLKY